MTVLVTGTSHNLGKAVALMLMDRGDRVIGVDIIEPSIDSQEYPDFISLTVKKPAGMYLPPAQEIDAVVYCMPNVENASAEFLQDYYDFADILNIYSNGNLKSFTAITFANLSYADPVFASSIIYKIKSAAPPLLSLHNTTCNNLHIDIENLDWEYLLKWVYFLVHVNKTVTGMQLDMYNIYRRDS